MKKNNDYPPLPNNHNFFCLKGGGIKLLRASYNSWGMDTERGHDLFNDLQALGVPKNRATRVVRTLQRFFDCLNDDCCWPEPKDWLSITDTKLEAALIAAFGPRAPPWQRKYVRFGLQHLIGPVVEPRSLWPVFWATCNVDGPEREYIRFWMQRSTLVRRGGIRWRSHRRFVFPCPSWDLSTVIRSTTLVTIQFTAEDDAAKKDAEVWDGRWPLPFGATYGIYLRIDPDRVG